MLLLVQRRLRPQLSKHLRIKQPMRKRLMRPKQRRMKKGRFTSKLWKKLRQRLRKQLMIKQLRNKLLLMLKQLLMRLQLKRSRRRKIYQTLYKQLKLPKQPKQPQQLLTPQNQLRQLQQHQLPSQVLQQPRPSHQPKVRERTDTIFIYLKT